MADGTRSQARSSSPWRERGSLQWIDLPDYLTFLLTIDISHDGPQASASLISAEKAVMGIGAVHTTRIAPADQLGSGNQRILRHMGRQLYR